MLAARDLGGRDDGEQPTLVEPADRVDRLVEGPRPADPVVLLPVGVVEAHADLQRIRSRGGEGSQLVGHGRVDEGAVGQHGGGRGPERQREEREDVAVQERLAAREVDFLDAQLLRLADGRSRHLGAQGLEPGLLGAGSIDAVGALEIAPRPRDLDPQGGEAQEGSDGGVSGRRRHDERQAHGSSDSTCGGDGIVTMP
jgi:hypothetical protein